MHLSDFEAWLSDALDSALGGETFDILGIAVSGGSDSLGLLHLAGQWSKRRGVRIKAVTVDHGLRPESAAEARSVAGICQLLGVDHATLKWQGWDRSGNLQDQARRARYRLMADWALAEGIGVIALGHTADDQAETFLMRLAREAGVDGLSGMATRRQAHGVVWLRPLLQVRRQQLRDYLTSKGVCWTDDPSNEDTRYDRVRARHALAALAPLGIDVAGLSAVAANLRGARDALEHQTRIAAESVALVEAGDIIFDGSGFLSQPAEIGRRLLVHAIKWVSSAEYGPRGSTLLQAHRELLDGSESTLHGCRLLRTKAGFRVTREWQAVKDQTSMPDAVWDRRWRLSGPENNGLAVRALGETGLAFCPDWRDTGRPRASLLASPAVWRGDALIAAPVAGKSNGWTATLVHPPNHFARSIISH